MAVFGGIAAAIVEVANAISGAHAAARMRIAEGDFATVKDASAFARTTLGGQA